jgi:DNA-directed RNA polymerase subunit K/omega
MTENPNPPETNGSPAAIEEHRAPEKPKGPTVPKPHNRSPEIDRKIRAAVERMFEDVQNPYEAVIIAAQEARRINERRLKSRSIVNQAMEHAVEELVPEVPFIPRPVEDEEPEVKPTNEAVEKLACGLVAYEVGGEVVAPTSYYEGEIDFPLYEVEEEEEAKTEGP